MKFACLSDWHITYDNPVARRENFIETEKTKLEFIFSYCKENNLTLLSSGDIFDGPRSWRAFDLLSDILRRYSSVEVFTVLGQHDIYYRNLDLQSTSIGAIIKWGGIKLLSNEPVKFANFKEHVHVYGMHFGQEEIPKVVNPDACNILVVHKMITDRPLWKGQEAFTDASYFLSKTMGHDYIFVGDAHVKFLIEGANGRIIGNTGPLLRAEAKADMFQHHPCIFVYDTETYKVEEIEIPHEPAEMVLSRQHIEWANEKDEMLTNFIHGLKEHINSSDDTKVNKMDFSANLLSYMQLNDVPKAIQDIISDVMEEIDSK